MAFELMLLSVCVNLSQADGTGMKGDGKGRDCKSRGYWNNRGRERTWGYQNIPVLSHILCVIY